jgi:hypothetical protein
MGANTTPEAAAGASASAPARSGGTVSHYRFRLRAPDGREFTSAVLAVRGGAAARGGEVPLPGGAAANTLAAAEANDVLVKVTDASSNPVPDLTYELTLPDGTVKKGKTGSGGEIEARGLAKGGDFKLMFPDLDKGGGGGGAPQKPASAVGDQLPAGMVGAACFAGIVAAPLTDAEEQFILSLAKKHSSEDDHLRLMRLVFKAYCHLGASPPVAAGMSSQFVIESDWGRATTGKYNYFGIKGQPGTKCTTSEHNLSEAAVDQLRAQDLYIGEETRADGTVVHKIKAWFRDYASLADALKGKVHLLQSGGPRNTYGKHQVWESPTPEEFCKRIKDAGYATAVDYTQALIGRLRLVDGYAFKKKGKTVQVVQETANADVDPARFEGAAFA